MSKVCTTIPADAKALGDIRKLVLEVTDKACTSDDCVRDFTVAVIEAMTNAIRHSKCTSITLEMNMDHANIITARIVDDGCGFSFSPNRCQFPSYDKESGRGIPIMNSLVDTFAVKSKPNQGTEVILVKKIGVKRPTRTA